MHKFIADAFLSLSAPKVSDVRVLEGVIIDWMPLTDDCVEISEYHVQFRVGKADDGSPFITVNRTKAVYEVNVTADLPLTGEPIYVVVSRVHVQCTVNICAF